jgi:GT2 family glycosyltransferase
MTSLSPIVLFVYNRLKHTQDTISALQKNTLASESHLIIYSDAASIVADQAKVEAVRDYLTTVSGFKSIEINEAKVNIGCDNSIIRGVSDVVNKFGTVIVLEDDHVTSANFLTYMNDALAYYKSSPSIAGISGYSPPIEIRKNYTKDFYVSGRGSSWGWATWSKSWNAIDWKVPNYQSFKLSKAKKAKFNRFGDDMSDMLIYAMEKEKVPYWDIRRCYFMHLNDLKFIYPVVSKVKNIGTDGSGLHCGKSNWSDVTIDAGTDRVNFSDDIEFDDQIIKAFKRFYNGPVSLKRYIVILLKKINMYSFIRSIIK